MIPPLLARVLVRTGIARLMPSVARQLGADADTLRYHSDRLLAGPWRDLEPLSGALAPLGPEVIDLARGVPSFGAPTLGAFPPDARAWPHPDGLPDLRQAVARELHAHRSLQADPNGEVLITAGALGAVQTVFDAFVNRGDRVVLFDPSSPLYPLAARTRRARVRWLRSWVEEGRTCFRRDHLARSLRGARLLVLQAPANPTGGLLAPEDLEAIAWWADKLDVLLVCDEAFAHFCYDAPPSHVATVAQARARTLTVGSVSKTHGLPGLRVGWLAGPRPLLRACRLTSYLRSPFVSAPAQHLALSVLQSGGGALAGMKAELASRRVHVYEQLQRAGLAPTWPGGGFFIWLPVAQRDFARQLLRDRQVRVAPGALFGPSGELHVRLSFAAEEGRLLEGLTRLIEHSGAERPGTRAEAA